MSSLDLCAAYDGSQAGPSAVKSSAKYLNGSPVLEYLDDDEDAHDNGGTAASSSSSPRWPLEQVNIFVPEDLHHLPFFKATRQELPQSPSLLTGWAARGGPGEVLVVICHSITPQQAAERGLEPVNHLRGTFGLIGEVQVTQPQDEQAGTDRTGINGFGKNGSQRDAKGKGREISSIQQSEGPAVWIHATSQLRSRTRKPPYSGSRLNITR